MMEMEVEFDEEAALATFEKFLLKHHEDDLLELLEADDCSAHFGISIE